MKLWDHLRRAAGAVLIMALGAMVAGAEAARAKTETVTVRSGNPFNFVEAIADPDAGGPIELNVELGFPEAGEGPFPAVLFVHGSGGPQTHHAEWRALFAAAGYATAYADHFAPRGGGVATGDHIELTGAAMAVDALRILTALRADPRIDPERIVIMGASKGGGVALYTAWEKLRGAVAGDARFAGHIALYPTCVFFDLPDMTSSPIRFLVGEADSWTGIEDCAESAAALAAAGADSEILLYSEAEHGFDSSTPVRDLPNGFDVRGCRFSIDADGLERASGVAMSDRASKRAALGACIARGVRYGGHASAREAARADVAGMLAAWRE